MKKTLTILALCFAAFIMHAQQTDRCASMLVYEQHQQDVSVGANMAISQSAARAWYNAHYNQIPRTSTIITIPVVVHVVYITPQENITDAQIYSQIAVLNADFQRTNADSVSTPTIFDSIAANVGIEFCLASVDPNGNPTNGITRTSSTGGSFGAFFNPFTEDVKTTATGGIDPWPTNQYLNIWVCKLFPGLLGYAQFPGDNPATDGVAITYTAFGTIGTVTAPSTLGRTATHEIGHWLGLYHIWGDDSDCTTGSDSIADTPNAAGASASDCNVTANDCANEDPWWGSVDPPNMVQNYMDYSHDSCMNMFTNGQKTRMLSFLYGDPARFALFSSPGGCNPLGTTEFTFDRYFSIYPNPTNNLVMVSYFGKWDATMTVDVLDITGKVVMTQAISQYNYSIDLSLLPAGVYTLRFIGEGGVAAKRVIKN
jgi:Pregnancy-associated plasma protein-A/Secretion system C-terminal sorting domain